MKKLLLTLVVITLISFTIKGQTADRKINFGVYGGAIQYSGDLGSGLFNFGTLYGFKGLSFSTWLSERWDFSLQASFGQTGFTKNSSESFHAQFWSLTALVKYKFIKDESAKLSPYAIGGIGYMRFAKKYTMKMALETMQIPQVGLGITYKLSPVVNIYLQEALIYNDHDNIDNDKSQYNDMFLTHTLGISFNMGKEKVKDSDGDGVPDNLDKCPNTPKGVKVDVHGCPLDTDGDGVPDYLDKCPGTPKDVKVDANGCPLDSDGDGVADYLDKCPNTAKGVKVDANGCPIDTDGDGVPDYLDKCPDTPAGVAVDINGCPLDTDGDGIPDYLDKCPTVKGTKENKGCPEVKVEEKKVFNQALQGIQFETGKSVIKPVSFKILDNIVSILNNNPQYNLSINGHTDNVGKSDKNMVLSQERADAVKAYFIGKGINAKRLTAKGWGDTQPVDDNKTAKGRTQNRRVEFKVEF